MLAAKSDYRRIVATSQDGRILLVDFGIYKDLPNYNSRDGTTVEHLDLLRGTDHTTEIVWRNPVWPKKSSRDRH
jgi:F-box and WD-40 domain protein 1/11